MEKLNIIFMGTPKFSVPVLKMLIENYNVIGVFTQIDKPSGRKNEIIFSPIKQLALDNNIKVFQPLKLKEETELVFDLKPDIIITCAYGQILPEEVINYPKYGCINVHASLLPKLRGGDPIHKAIIYGYKQTGITIMYMDKNMDTGDIINTQEIDIEEIDTYDTLHDKLSLAAPILLQNTLEEIISNKHIRIKQNDNEATYAYIVKKEEEKIDFNKSTKDVYNQIRGLSSVPGAYTTLDNKIIKVYSAKKDHNDSNKKPGTIININKDSIGVKTLDGEILLTEIQMEGKKRTLVKDYLNGIDSKKLLGRELK
ncbi:MAG TPA: methionyl-tRNA formyltransferase [Bacilli bacterium]|nr:methionyl-tRNA formyltransferase [Bacilli bacterium]